MQFDSVKDFHRMSFQVKWLVSKKKIQSELITIYNKLDKNTQNIKRQIIKILTTIIQHIYMLKWKKEINDNFIQKGDVLSNKVFLNFLKTPGFLLGYINILEMN